MQHILADKRNRPDLREEAVRGSSRLRHVRSLPDGAGALQALPASVSGDEHARQGVFDRHTVSRRARLHRARVRTQDGKQGSGDSRPGSEQV